ncbi:hypothetical protein GCM10027057_17460 [Marisediminicola antarctica]
MARIRTPLAFVYALGAGLFLILLLATLERGIGQTWFSWLAAAGEIFLIAAIVASGINVLRAGSTARLQK